MSNPFNKPAETTDDDFSVDVPSSAELGFKIPAGEYAMKLLDVEKAISKSSGNPMFVWTFTINEGEHSGREFKLFTSLSANAMWKLVETLVGLGVLEPGDAQTVSFKRSEVLGTECRGVITDDNYNGQDRSNLDKILPAA